MQLRDIKRDFEHGLLTSAEISRCMGAYSLRVKYRSGEWVVLERQRSGQRLLKTADAAIAVAEEVGFKNVSFVM